jgi:3-methylcrotonyl-CoA carboxylase beta subunit
MVIANDATVKGGTYYGMTCKQARARAGGRLGAPAAVHHAGRQRRRLPARHGQHLPRRGQFGSIFNNQVRMSAEGIPRSRW